MGVSFNMPKIWGLKARPASTTQHVRHACRSQSGQLTSFASIVISAPAKTLETGQFSLAVFAAS